MQIEKHVQRPNTRENTKKFKNEHNITELEKRGFDVIVTYGYDCYY